MTGNGSVGEGVKETWRTGVVLIIVWIVVREYTAWCLYLLTVLCTSFGYSRLWRTIVDMVEPKLSTAHSEIGRLFVGESL